MVPHPMASSRPTSDAQQPQRLLKAAAHAGKAGVGLHQLCLAAQIASAVLGRHRHRRGRLEHPRPRHLERRIGLRQRERIPDAAHDVQPGLSDLFENVRILRAQPGRERGRHGELGRQARRDAEKALGRDADNRDRRVLDENGAADDAGVAAEALLPGAVAQHADRLPAIVVGSQQPAERRHDAQRLVDAAGRVHDVNRFRAGVEGHMPAVDRPAERALQRRHLTLHFANDRIGERGRVEVDQPIGTRHGQLPQHNLIDQREAPRRRRRCRGQARAPRWPQTPASAPARGLNRSGPASGHRRAAPAPSPGCPPSVRSHSRQEAPRRPARAASRCSSRKTPSISCAEVGAEIAGQQPQQERDSALRSMTASRSAWCGSFRWFGPARSQRGARLRRGALEPCGFGQGGFAALRRETVVAPPLVVVGCAARPRLGNPAVGQQAFDDAVERAGAERTSPSVRSSTSLMIA